MQKLLLNLMPTDEDRASIQEARAARPDVPLGPAEEFLFTLSSIPELKARLSLWRFIYAFQVRTLMAYMSNADNLYYCTHITMHLQRKFYCIMSHAMQRMAHVA